MDWGDDETWAGTMPVIRPSMTTGAMIGDPGLGLQLAVLAGRASLSRTIEHTRIQKSGLALAGHFHGIVPSRIQILGQTEQSFLNNMSTEARQHALEGFFGLELACVVLTGESTPRSHAELIEAAERTRTPLLTSQLRSSATITAIHSLLDDRLAPRRRLHGVLIDVFGVGLMLMGPSGVGKSEAALDLVMRGHRLVADDAVECDYRPPGMVFGQPAELLRYHLEVRGLGILNVKDLFGVTAIRERKRIDVVARLEEWVVGAEYDRMGVEERFSEILGVAIPELAIPVRPGRDMASILEVAARNELSKHAGHHAAREFFNQLEGALGVTQPVESAVPPPVVSAVPESSVGFPVPSRPGGGGRR